MVLTASSASAAEYSGSDFTADKVLADRLTRIFEGELELYWDAQCKSPVSAPLGTRLLTTANTFYVREEHSGKLFSGSSCYIYANAVYRTLFGDVPYHGYSDTWQNSRLSAGYAKEVSYDSFKEWDVTFGSLLRSTSKSDGSYSSSTGHSLIILSYDRDGVTYLEANGDGKGLVRVITRTWDAFNSALFYNRGYVLSFIVSPTVHLGSNATTGGSTASGGNVTSGGMDAVQDSTYAGYISRKRAYPGFYDVSDVSWYKPYVSEAYVTGLISGCGDGRFCPGDTLSNAESVALVSRLLSEYWGDEYSFTGGQSWYSSYYTYLSIWGISPKGSDPSGSMTRGEFAELVYKAIPVSELTAIRSGKLWDTDSAAVTALYRAGVVQGTGGKYSPDSPVTRAEAAAILARVVNRTMRA